MKGACSSPKERGVGSVATGNKRKAHGKDVVITRKDRADWGKAGRKEAAKAKMAAEKESVQEQTIHVHDASGDEHIQPKSIALRQKYNYYKLPR